MAAKRVHVHDASVQEPEDEDDAGGVVEAFTMDKGMLAARKADKHQVSLPQHVTTWVCARPAPALQSTGTLTALQRKWAQRLTLTALQRKWAQQSLKKAIYGKDVKVIPSRPGPLHHVRLSYYC